MKVIASVCERAAGRGGKASRASRQTSQQEQSATTATIRETLRKNSVTATSLPSPSNSQLNPGSLPAGNFAGPSLLPSFDSLEKSEAQFEAEAELELLMMQEEMSELRIGVSVPENSWTQSLSGDSSQTSSRAEAGGGGSCGEAEGISGNVSELSHASNSSVAREGRVATTAGVVGERSQQLTVDSKEKERLEDIMAVAQ